MDETGSALLELAISAPVFFVMLLGVVQFCLAIYTSQCLSETARETARWAATRGSTSCTNTPYLTDCNASASEINGYAQGLGYPGILANNLTVSTTWLSKNGSTDATWSTCTSSDCNAPGNAVQVNVQYQFPLDIPVVGSDTVTLSSSGQMVISQ